MSFIYKLNLRHLIIELNYRVVQSLTNFANRPVLSFLLIDKSICLNINN